MQDSRRLAAVLLGLWGLAAGCGRCSPPPAPVQGTFSGVDLDGGQEEDGGIPAGELGWIQPLDTRLFQLAGEKDDSNRYPFAVMVKTRAPMEAGVQGECSGVLISPKLVLTAGHCVCVRRKEQAPGIGGGSVIDGSACSEKAAVLIVNYEHAGQRGGVLTARPQLVRGAVRPHPKLRVVMDSQGKVLSSEADLATVVLSQRVEGTDAPVLAEVEPREGEIVVVVSYGYDEVLGGIDGQRRFKAFKTAQALSSSPGRFVFEQPDRGLFKGDSGGPVLFVHDGKTRLGGISTAALGEEATFVSTYFHRDWIAAELEHAGRRE
jgi:hypothetical protein